jgi:hypothetical protein
MSDTVIRAVTLPVATPVDLDWKQLDAALTPALRLATELANWCVRRLFVLDDPTSPKTPAAIKTWYGYEDASKNYPDVAKWAGAMASLNLVTRAVQRKYAQQRFSVIVRHDSSLLTYRFPQPFPIHNACWNVAYESRSGLGAQVAREDQGNNAAPIFSANLPGVGRIRLRLRQGKEFGRQLAMLRQILSGEAKRGEAALCRDRKGKLMVKMVGTFPAREPNREPVNACFLHTDPGALLVAEVNGRSVSITNGDHIRRAVAKHKTFLQRASEDKKREVRMDRQQRANFNKAIETRCDKQANRVDTAIHQIAAQVVRFCERLRVGVVVYDDSSRDFIPEGFAWHAVGERLADKLRATGITLLARKDLNPEEFEAWRQEPSLVRATALAGARLVATANRKGPHPSVTAAPTRKSPPTAPTCRTRRSARSSSSAATSPSAPPETRASSSAA